MTYPYLEVAVQSLNFYQKKKKKKCGLMKFIYTPFNHYPHNAKKYF